MDHDTSRRLGRIRQRDTKPERLVRLLLTDLGHSYRTNNRDLPGSPDVANRSQAWAIFVHGCFWHRHLGCSRTTTPKRNREFWQAKFEQNVQRDRRVCGKLRRYGFTVLTVWECEIERRPDTVRSKFLRFLPEVGN